MAGCTAVCCCCRQGVAISCCRPTVAPCCSPLSLLAGAARAWLPAGAGHALPSPPADGEGPAGLEDPPLHLKLEKQQGGWVGGAMGQWVKDCGKGGALGERLNAAAHALRLACGRTLVSTLVSAAASLTGYRMFLPATRTNVSTPPPAPPAAGLHHPAGQAAGGRRARPAGGRHQRPVCQVHRGSVHC